MSGHARPPYATEMIDLDRPHAEVIDPETREVWQSIEPCDAEELAALWLPEPLRPIGVGCGAMDEHWFDRSPGASEDGPMKERTIAGRRFGHCARPASLPTKPLGEDGPTALIVDKYHALRFVAGRRVSVLRLPDESTFVHVINGAGVSSIGLGHAPEGQWVLPAGCRLGEVAVEKDWVLRLPSPAQVYFFASGDSYQGPLETLPGPWEPLR